MNCPLCDKQMIIGSTYDECPSPCNLQYWDAQMSIWPGYYLDGVLYTEEEMVRVAKLKAFL
jgi:hypothetical protein